MPHVEDWKAIVWHLLEASEHTRVDRVGINKHHLLRVRNEAEIVVEGQTRFGQHP
jgi:alpha-tubulin suppressor-like RCC1 family protein